MNDNRVPEGYTTVTPWIIVRGAENLLDYLKAAFDAEELSRLYNEDGLIGHAEVRIGDAVVMLFDAREAWPPTPSFLRLYVADGDAVYQRALEAGGTSVTEMTELFFGDRVGRVCDPAGNIWWIQTRAVDLAPEDMAQRAQEQAFNSAMQYVQRSLDQELSRRKRN